MTAPNVPNVSVPEVDDEPQIGDGLPRIHWMNGDRKAGTPGYFWTAASQYDDPPTEPWQAKTIAHDSGGTTEAYVTERLRIAVITWRTQAILDERDPGGKNVRTYYPRANMIKGSRESVYVEVMALAEGMATPVVWSSPSIKTSMAIIANGGILDTAKRQLQDIAAKPNVWGMKLNRWAFWLPIKTTMEIDAKTGKPAIFYEPTKGKPVTPPKVYIPKDDPLSLYVGDDAYSAGYEVYLQFPGWSKERRSSEELPTEEPAAPGRNVPRPIETEEEEAPAF
jgi:hypothetical protein